MPSNSPEACTTDFTAALIERDMKLALTFLTDDVVFLASNGSAIRGKDAFASWMTAGWNVLEDYSYTTADPVWVARSDAVACVVHAFAWTARVQGETAGGRGRATRVLTGDSSGWRIAHEHVSARDWGP